MTCSIKRIFSASIFTLVPLFALGTDIRHAVIDLKTTQEPTVAELKQKLDALETKYTQERQSLELRITQLNETIEKLRKDIAGPNGDPAKIHELLQKSDDLLTAMSASAKLRRTHLVDRNTAVYQAANRYFIALHQNVLSLRFANEVQDATSALLIDSNPLSYPEVRAVMDRIDELKSKFQSTPSNTSIDSLLKNPLGTIGGLILGMLVKQNNKDDRFKRAFDDYLTILPILDLTSRLHSIGTTLATGLSTLKARTDKLSTDLTTDFPKLAETIGIQHTRSLQDTLDNPLSYEELVLRGTKRFLEQLEGSDPSTGKVATEPTESEFIRRLDVLRQPINVVIEHLSTMEGILSDFEGQLRGTSRALEELSDIYKSADPEKGRKLLGLSQKYSKAASALSPAFSTRRFSSYRAQLIITN